MLGDQADNLTVGEVELVILAACLHDLGMVYTEEEEQQSYKDEVRYKKFLKKYCPELMGEVPKDWPENIRQWYLRTLHPFRISDVLYNEEWKRLFERCPLDVVPKRCILAVCQAHGEEPRELRNNRDLEYLPANNVNPLFCALLLRLGDLLDFDDTRAPKILYSYVACNEKSREEWNKHQASGGFIYPPSPSVRDLPYKARCTNPGVEHAVRDFLDWIDDELDNCTKLQKYCSARWQQEFPFPREVSRGEIESDGYMSGDFCLTMDQEQILNLLIGENLYDNLDVFVRELLQNAIDATLLRGEMDQDFVPEESRIDFWEWNDKEGNIWFRIDDHGIGMTLGMLQRYFLKVGNSYYTSKELDRDMRDHGRTKSYRGISRFGIGFLSSFLCGDYAEVSTLYFNSEKNRREESESESYHTQRYGLRMQITGLSGYYTLKNQARQHQTDEKLPAPCGNEAIESSDLEWNGYRAKPGTSIVIRLVPGKLGALDLRKTVEKYLCCARVPVYYNNRRVGRTYEEAMQAVHEAAGESTYELTPETKKEFDRSFPALCGQYPKLVATVIPLDTEENQILSGVAGVMIRYDVRFEKEPVWKVKDQTYQILGKVIITNQKREVVLACVNRISNSIYIDKWENITEKYNPKEVAELETELEKCSVCPLSGEQLGEVWKPFAEEMELYMVWVSYLNYQQKKEVRFSVTESGFPSIKGMLLSNSIGKINCVYQGVMAGHMRYSVLSYPMGDTLTDYLSEFSTVFFLGEEWKPQMEVSRSKMSDVPLEALVAICAHIAGKCAELINRGVRLDIGQKIRIRSLKTWREVRTVQFDRKIKKNLKAFFEGVKSELQKPMGRHGNRGNRYLSDCNCVDDILYVYLMAEFQDVYDMTINYEEGQTIVFRERDKKYENEAEDRYDLFPPMMFCKGAGKENRRYISAAAPRYRRGITADHPYIEWLLDNSVRLNQYYQRQFQQIICCLCEKNAKNIVNECNYIREQLIALSGQYSIGIESCPKLSEEDFYGHNFQAD